MKKNLERMKKVGKKKKKKGIWNLDFLYSESQPAISLRWDSSKMLSDWRKEEDGMFGADGIGGEGLDRGEGEGGGEEGWLIAPCFSLLPLFASSKKCEMVKFPLIARFP